MKDSAQPFKWRPLKQLSFITSGDQPDAADLDPEGQFLLIGGGRAISRSKKSNAKEDTIVIGRVGSSGSLYWADHPIFVTDNGFKVKARKFIHSKWLYYALHTVDWGSLTGGTAQPLLTGTALKNVRVPSRLHYPEQQKIADYLDHETADIDAAVSDQKQFIELLEERKQALTWRSVSGTDQIGNRIETGDAFWRSIPEDWALQKLGWNFKIGNGSTPSTSTSRFWSDSGFPWVNSSVVNQPLVTEPARHVSEAALQELHLPIVPSGSLLIGITGQGKTRGTVTKLGITTTINQHVAYLAPLNEQRVTTDYTRAALEASYLQLRHISDGNGGTKGALTCEMLQQFKIPIPPRDVQDQIVKMLTSQSARISSALDDASAVIDLARERRAALITAAVTGQIDVTARNKPAAEQLEDDVAQGLQWEYA